MARKTFYLSVVNIKWLIKKAKEEARSVSNFLDIILDKIRNDEK